MMTTTTQTSARAGAGTRLATSRASTAWRSLTAGSSTWPITLTEATAAP